MSISDRLRITFAALQVVMEGRVTGRRSSSGQVSRHPPRLPDLPVAFLRILIDDPAGEVAHLM